MTQILSTTGHRTAFNNVKNSNFLVGYKRPGKKNVNNSNETYNGLI